MAEQNWLAQQFEANRVRLNRVAFRMLGSSTEADDAVQETWLRLSRSDTTLIDNLAAWLTTVVARICLDMLRSHRARREDTLDSDGADQLADAAATDPEREAILADSLGPALLVVLDMLSPPERVAFVLHDMFGMAFEEIATIIGRSVTASRQLASRARRRVRGQAGDPAEPGEATESAASGRARRVPVPINQATEAVQTPESDQPSERRIVDAFLLAARQGDFQALLALLHPDCVLHSDKFAASIGSPAEIKGGPKVAEFFNGKAAGASRATIHGIAGAAWAMAGQVRVAFSFRFVGDQIVDIELIGDRHRLKELAVVLLDS